MDNSNVREDDWESQLIDYSLGVMEPGDADGFASSLAECREHVFLARQYEQAVAWLGAAVPSAEPPEGHKSRLLSRLSSTPQSVSGMSASTAIAPRPVAPLGIAAPVSAEREEAPRKVVDITQYRERRRNTIIAALGAVAAALILVVGLNTFFGGVNKGTLTIPPGYAPVQLASQPGFQGSAVVLYDPSKNDATLLAAGFPQVPQGKVYEFWILPKTGNPIRAGTFVPDSSGAGKHETTTAQNVGNYAGFAVSLENAPGVDVPTQVVALGKFANP